MLQLSCLRIQTVPIVVVIVVYGGKMVEAVRVYIMEIDIVSIAIILLVIDAAPIPKDISLNS